MATSELEFMAGVIEGFYGQPWSTSERLALFDAMADLSLNTYLYAPKDDLKRRGNWREPYTENEASALRELIDAARARHLCFIYALGPGLDILYSSELDVAHLRQRFGQMLALGCEHFALLFDDIPDRLAPEDAARFGSFASAQCQVANALFRWVRERAPSSRFLFCPTAYCGRMAERNLGGAGYLSIVGRELLPEIEIFWTGPEIISEEIPVAHVQALELILRRKPVIWDNLHANDYDGRRFYCGPFAGRSPELRTQVGGLLMNPNNEFPLNYVPLRTFAEFVRCPGKWDARAAYVAAMRAWLVRFTTTSAPVDLDDLILLGDCYYLPHQEGPGAEAFFSRARELLNMTHALSSKQVAAFRRDAVRLRDLCARLAELRDRPLFYALSRRIWELREELDLLIHYVEARAEGNATSAPFRSDFHLPATYRGGMVPRLQRLLIQQPDRIFVPESGCASPRPSS